MTLKRSGIIDLPLHAGKAPHWLVERMKNLSFGIVKIILEEYGADEFIRRLSDPFWFQCFSCVLAYDWHSSGTTTVVCGVLKSVINAGEFGLFIAGGKGRSSRKTPEDIETFGERLGLGESERETIKDASRLCAKVDNSAIQDGYSLYHHSIAVSESGRWTVIQQGMDVEDKTARRYHWLYGLKSFVEDPHEGIVCDFVRDDVLNMTDKKSKKSREISTDLVCERTDRLRRSYENVLNSQTTLTDWEDKRGSVIYTLPKRVNWAALEKAYEIQPKNYEEMLNIRGIGPATVRALALISELVYGGRVSWEDPVRYSFAFGGKDGVPYPVEKKRMDETTEMLMNAIEEAKIGGREKLETIKKLKDFSVFAGTQVR
jgi:hypothetical protein